MHCVRAYKMIFAVLDRRLIQLLIKCLQFLSIVFAVFINNFTNNLVIILLFVIERCLFMFVQIKYVGPIWYVVFSSNFYGLTFNTTTRIV